MSQIRLSLFRLINAICLSAVSGRGESNAVFDVAIENPPSLLTYEKEDPPGYALVAVAAFSFPAAVTILFAQSQKPLVAPTKEEKTLNKVPLETKKGAEMKGDPGAFMISIS